MVRILLLLFIIAFVFCYGAYFVKGDRRYLRLLGQLIKYALIALGLFFMVKFI